MSKLIVDMEMPKNMCCDCEISIDGFACKKARMDGGRCPIKGEISEVELMHLEEERAFAARNIAAERKDDEQIH